MKIENMLQRFSCVSFLFKPPCLDQRKLLLLCFIFSERFLVQLLIFFDLLFLLVTYYTPVRFSATVIL